MLRPLEYRVWSGKRRPRALRCWSIARTGMMLVFRRKIFWAFLFLGFINFFLHCSLVYLITVQVKLAAQDVPFALAVPDRLLGNFAETGKGYRDFIFSQGVVLMIMLGFAGAIIVGNDFRFRATAFYLSRPINRADYFLGKLLAVVGIAALLTVIPALVLFLEYGAFSESFAYYVDNVSVLIGIVAYGTLICVVTGTVLLGVASLLEKTIPTLIVWGGIFVFFPIVGNTLRRTFGERGGDDPWWWGLIDLWSVLRWTANFLFGIRVERYSERLPWALGVIGLWVLGSVLVFWWRLRRTEVVR